MIVEALLTVALLFWSLVLGIVIAVAIGSTFGLLLGMMPLGSMVAWRRAVGGAGHGLWKNAPLSFTMLVVVGAAGDWLRGGPVNPGDRLATIVGFCAPSLVLHAWTLAAARLDRRRAALGAVPERMPS